MSISSEKQKSEPSTAKKDGKNRGVMSEGSAVGGSPGVHTLQEMHSFLLKGSKLSAHPVKHLSISLTLLGLLLLILKLWPPSQG